MSAPDWTQPVDLGQDDVHGSGAEHVSVCDSTPLQSATSSKKQKTSDAWIDFYAIEEGGKWRAQCKYCPKSYALGDGKGKYGTRNLITHAAKCKNKKASQSQGERNEDETISRAFDQDVYREKAAECMMAHNYPFLMVEHKHTRALHSYLNPNVKQYTRNTAKSDCLKIYNKEKEALKIVLEKVPGRICLTSDVWTSSMQEGYICLTAHFIDCNWKLHSRILNFHHLLPPHTGMVMSDEVYEFLKDWGIENKIFSLTLDNASSNDNMQVFLKAKLRGNLVCGGEYFHVRCCAHILNLIVQDGLKIISNTVKNIRSSVLFVKATEGRKIKFVECCKQSGVPFEMGLRSDCITRWNSTYKMLDCALKYREAFSSYNNFEALYECCPTPCEWDVAEKIAEFLKPFSVITDMFSGSEYPTSNLYFTEVWKIHLLLFKNLISFNDDIREMANSMMPKFEKYWDEYSTILSLAVILDPRYKIQFVRFCLNKVEVDERSVEKKLDKILGVLKSLFEEYVVESERSSSQQTPNALLQLESNTTSSASKRHIELDEFDLQDNTISTRSEVDIYLEEKKFPTTVNLDILKYWKYSSDRFPTLSMLARDILTIPITTVASESAFSIGSKVLTKYRSSLLPDNAEALICGRNWLNGYEVESDEPTDADLHFSLLP